MPFLKNRVRNCRRLLFIFVPLLAWSADEPSAVFLKQQYGVREQAFAGAGSAAEGGPGFFCVNPAALANTEKRLLHMNRITEFGDITRSLIAGTYHFSRFSMGLGLLYMEEGAGIIADEDGIYDDNTTVQSNEFLPVLSLAAKTPRGIAGISLKAFQSQIMEHKRTGFAVDAGVQLSHPQITVGLTVMNAGKVNSFSGEKELLPLLVRGGLARKQNIRMAEIELMTDAVYSYYDERMYFPVALELSAKDAVYLRCGYPVEKEVAPFHLGGGIRYKLLQIDYTYTFPADDLEPAHGFGVTFWGF